MHTPTPAIDITTEVPRSCDEVWQIVTTPEGVNAELMPLVRMSFPPTDLTFTTAPLGQPLFHSWLLLFGFLPFDRHTFVLHETGPRHFIETSHSLMQKLWRHERYLSETENGTLVHDIVTVVPRLGFMSPLTNAVVAFIFRHRHRQIARHYGADKK
tara:strand:- start:69600 stop:70067 length:468 start_codon:yes stop_codon:yes gene_type:complete